MSEKQLTAEEIWAKLEQVAEKTCKSLRAKYPGADVRWRKEGNKIITSWNGEDLHEMGMEHVRSE